MRVLFRYAFRVMIAFASDERLRRVVPPLRGDTPPASLRSSTSPFRGGKRLRAVRAARFSAEK